MPSRFVQTTDGVRLHIRLESTGELPRATCLLLHGFGDSGDVWEHTCAALREVCATASVDLRGHGDSGHSPAGVYDVVTNVQDMRTAVTELGLGPLILIGHSFGGEIALRLAARPTAPVIGTVFVDIAPGFNEESAKRASVQMQQTLRVYASVDEYSSLLMSMRPLLAESTARQLARGALRECDDGFRLKLDPALMRYADEEFTSAAEWRELLPAIRCPALVVRGAGSALVSANAARTMVGILQQGRMVTIPRAGHAVMSDNPAAWTAQIVDFVASLLRSRASA
jgi:pimeloyl-ACP methyl ester carboxylesterase